MSQSDSNAIAGARLGSAISKPSKKTAASNYSTSSPKEVCGGSPGANSIIIYSLKYKTGCVLWFLGLLEGIGEAGYVAQDFSRIFGAILSFSGLVLIITKKQRKDCAILAMGFLLLTLNIPQTCYYAGIALVLIGVLRLRHRTSYNEIFFPTVVVFVFEAVFFLFPEIVLLFSSLTQQITKSISSNFQAPAILGQTCFGLFPMILITTFVYTFISWKIRSKCRWLIIPILSILWALVIVAGSSILPELVRRFTQLFPMEGPIHYWNPPSVAEVIFYLPIAIFCIVSLLLMAAPFHFTSLTNQNPPGSTRKRVLTLRLFGAGFMSLLLLWSLCFGEAASNKSISFLDAGFADYDTPSFGKLGNATSGMFGLWERGLMASGYKVSHISHLTEIPRSLRLLVIINPKDISNEDAIAFKDFLEAGGNVLLLGDHTDLMGMIAPINKLLVPLGARWRFDSGFCIGHEWSHKYVWSHHPVTQGFDEYNELLQQGTGATIEISSLRWKPIITGKYTFSDIGNRLNSNSFLGDYKYEPGEILGDLCIVAERQVGRGKIIAFGDTSAFQNIAIAHSWPFIDKLHRYLSQERDDSPVWLIILFVIGLVLLTILGSECWAIYAALSSCIIAIITVCGHYSATQLPDMPIAYLDVTHANCLTLCHWRDRSIDGLIINCFRNGFWPVICHDEEQIKPGARDLYVCVSPCSALSSKEGRKLLRDAETGATILFSFGIAEHSNIPFLGEIGCKFQNIPLGPVPVRPKLSAQEFKKIMTEPQFSEAWPLKLSGDGWKSLYSWNEYCLVAEKQFGKGRVILLADPKFLWDKGLESEKSGWPGNIKFFLNLINKDNAIQLR